MGDFKTRKFNGKKYISTGSLHFSKKSVLKSQKFAKNKGYNTRIIKVKGLGKKKVLYRLYLRKK